MTSANNYSQAELALITKVSRLYYEQGIKQPAIAARLSLSQSKVSRLLALASELGIVRVSVISPSQVHSHLEVALCEKFGLRDAIVAHVDSDSEDAGLTAIGAAGANYLEATLSTNDKVGISSWSATLLAVVDSMHSRSAKATQVIQLQGGVGNAVAQVQATRLTDRLARITGAKPMFLAAPGVVASREVRDGLLQDQYISAVAASWDELTVALLGIGALEPSRLLADSGNTLAGDDLERLKRLGAVGDVCLHFFNQSGAAVPNDLEERAIGISWEKLRSVPRRVGLAGGLRKVDAIAAAARGNWIDVLVTDSITAEALLAAG